LQEKLIFFPQKLDKNYRFTFLQSFEEVSIQTKDHETLHGLLFKTENAKGLIFYLHGNAGSLADWGEVASVYTNLKYDVFLLDYRGYGKSSGSIQSEGQLLSDVQTAYSEMLKTYEEDKIIVLGYSIGTGPAAKLASTNGPKMLILQSPYYSLTDVVRHTVPIVPTFILKYKLETYQYIKDCKMPVVLIHGDRDEVIPYSQSLKLKPVLKQSDVLITLAGQPHNGMTFSPDYAKVIQKILNGQRN
jgi:pimeloyl-ACP methyl ester carboxylesterase